MFFNFKFFVQYLKQQNKFKKVKKKKTCFENRKMESFHAVEMGNSVATMKLQGN